MAGNLRRTQRRTALMQAAIALVALGLVVAAWVAALTASDIDFDLELRQARTQSANLALNFEEQVHRQLLAVDQTLRILKLDWERDPAAFDLAALQRRAGSLSDVLSQVLILDGRGRVVNGTRRDLIEADFSGRRYFQFHRRSDVDGALVDGPNRGSAGGSWFISVSRRLNSAHGVFAGVVVAGYDLAVLTRDMAQSDLGPRGIVMLVGRDGIVRALVNRVPKEPGDDVGKSELFRTAFSVQGGTWIGPSPLDGVDRVHAFRAVPGQDMTVIVGLDRAAVLAQADQHRQQALFAASAITVLVSLIAGGLCLAVGAQQQREMGLAHDRAVLAAANLELKLARDRADAKSFELETTFTGMSDGISMFDAQLRLVNWNHRFPALAGTPTELCRVGVPVEEILRAQARLGEFGPVDVEAEVARRMTVLRAGTNTGVIERQRPDGRTLELRRTSLPDGGFVTLYTDITVRKQAEAAQRRARELAEQTTEEKSRFVAIVSHEIRTPLNVALNALNLLESSDLLPAQRRLVENGLHAGAALMSLLNDILDLSRMEVGRLAIRPAPFALRPLLDGVVDMFVPAAQERGVDLALQIGPGVPDRVISDAGRLRQVLTNLISNAAKFAEPGPVRVRVGVTDGARPMLRFAVCDQGPKIPDLDRARLFRPFSQLERQRGTAVGTGLGLAICQLLTSLLGGTIGCDAVGETGKEFWLMLPLDQVEVRHELPPLRQVAIPNCLPRTRVLLVEDMPANQLIVATLLRREGHAVDIAGSGEEALPMLATRPYDLVFLDIFMPGMDGLEAARHIRAMPGPPARVPIVALTANVSPDDRVEYRSAGIDDTLPKPVERASMLAVLARFVWNGRSEAGAPGLAGQSGGAGYGGLARAPVPAGTSPGHDLPVLDKARLASLRGGLPSSIFVSLIKGAVDDLRDRLPMLHDAAEESDALAVKRVAHAMAGVAGSYGLAVMEAKLRRLMTGAETLDLQARDGVGGLADDLERAERAVRAMLEAEAA